MFSGGSDTVRQASRSYLNFMLRLCNCFQTYSTIYSFFLAMALFPEVQKCAQAEIDSVIGQDRLPTYKDREHLPYIEVLVQEVYRFFSVVPIGMLLSPASRFK